MERSTRSVYLTSWPPVAGRWEDGPVDLNEPTRSQNKWNELLEKLQGEWREVVDQGNIKRRKYHHKATGVSIIFTV